MRKNVIGKLHVLVNERGKQSKIDAFEEIIIDEIADTIEDEDFYSLPIEEIVKIIKKSEISEASVLIKLVSNTNKYKEAESPLILKAIESSKMSFDDCVGIISCLKNCPICTRIDELYKAERSMPTIDYKKENENLRKEIIELKKTQENKFPHVTKKPEDFENNIFTAIDKGKLDSVQYHIEELHVDVEKKSANGRSLLNYASYCGRRKIVEYLAESRGANAESKDNNGNTPLCNAALKGNLEIVEYLVEHCNADVNTKGNLSRTPIGYAAREGNLEIVKYLFEHRSVNIKDGDNKGFTPLLLAAEQDKLNVVIYLVKNCHANINATTTTFGQTPLHVASLHGNLRIVKFLVEECGDDVEKKGKCKCTPLYYAAQHGYLEVVKYLVEERHAKITSDIISVSQKVSEYLKSKLPK